jgi:hypothetical protein
MSEKLKSEMAVIGIDIGKNSFHIVGPGSARQHRAAAEMVARPGGSAACQPTALPLRHGRVHWGASSQSQASGAWPRCWMPAKYVRPYSKGEKNDYRDAEAIAEAVQRRTMKFVATKSAEQLDLQALHRVRERLVGQRTGIINQIRAFLLERSIAVRQGLHFLRAELPGILAKRTDVLSPACCASSKI